MSSVLPLGVAGAGALNQTRPAAAVVGGGDTIMSGMFSFIE